MRLQKNNIIFSEITETKDTIVKSGYFWGENCIGYNKSSGFVYDLAELTIITTQETYNKLSQEDEIKIISSNTDTSKGQGDEINQKVVSKIKVLIRIGRYEEISYRCLNLNISELEPLGDQKEIIKEIKNIYEKRKRASVLLTGPPRSGKSSVGYLLAKDLGAIFTHTFNPTDPGDTFSEVVMRAKEKSSEDNTPLIVVIEEVDIMIEKIHSNTVYVNPKIPTLVRDKTSWSTFMDDLVFYRDVIVILTSNKEKEWFDELDPSYLRKGRIDTVLTINTPIND